MEEEVKEAPKKDPFESLYKVLLKKPQGDVLVSRIKKLLES